MEKRVSPWINKKIVEYIGEPEPTLTDFICNKVLTLRDLYPVLTIYVVSRKGVPREYSQ